MRNTFKPNIQKTVRSKKLRPRAPQISDKNCMVVAGQALNQPPKGTITK
jgi:hypothetical protein